MSWKYFKKEEFACKCGCGKNEIQGRLIDKLDKIRDQCGFPFHITSGYRCMSHNEKVGGSPNSAHITGEAADIHCQFSSQRFLIVGVAMQESIRRIGIADTFIHLDVAKDKSKDIIWTY